MDFLGCQRGDGGNSGSADRWQDGCPLIASLHFQRHPAEAGGAGQIQHLSGGGEFPGLLVDGKGDDGVALPVQRNQPLSAGVQVKLRG